MKLLIFTQKIDKDDTVLGFFHDWVLKISERCESVQVICLQKGRYDLPKNVTVYSLGKEEVISKKGYIVNLYKILNRISDSYDKVFVHMNQEYVLLASLYWRLKGVPVYLWRNHPSGSLLTYISVALSTKVFCTSTASYTAKFSKTRIMPAGIDTDLFKPVLGVVRKKYSVCMVGRISRVKNNYLALEAFNILISQGVQVSLSFIGPVSDKDLEYLDGLKRYITDNKLSNIVSFVHAVPLDKLPEIYSSFEICLNLTESGSFDKTIVESGGCGTIPLVSSSSFKGLLPDVCITNTNPKNIADSIEKLIDATEQIKIQKDLEKFVDSQSLKNLMIKLFQEIK